MMMLMMMMLMMVANRSVSSQPTEDDVGDDAPIVWIQHEKGQQVFNLP